MEADEFDRSFHRLHPYMAVVTSVDADHLDIYGDQETMIQAYNEFCAKIRKNGNLLVNSKIKSKIVFPEGVNCFTYGMETDADYNAFNIRQEEGCFIFSVKTPGKIIDDLRFEFPGKINIENFTAAIGIALMCGVPEKDIRKAVLLFRGVKRRFDVRFNGGGITYIDDYGHHPEEIRACINAIKEYFSGRRITGIFQPHLYSRTRDHAEGFAEILDKLDEPILLPIYPAREKPIEGVSSEMILERMKSPYKKLMQKQDIPGRLDINKLDVLLTIGAGDIDTLVKPIEDMLRKAKA
jgi:UDP-N-acetylmuramate--alanine ligase